MANDQRSSSSSSAEHQVGSPKHDLEDGAAAHLDHTDVASPGAKDRAIKEAAGLLFVFSLFALVEGTARMVVNSNPAPAGLKTDFTASMLGARVPVAALLAGGIAEVIFGLGGVLVAMYSLVFDIQNSVLTLAFAALQSVLGWFVFITFVLAVPIDRAHAGPPGGDEFFLSTSEYRAVVIIGQMIGSITFCYALQGGQFIMALNLMSAQKGEQWNQGKARMRAFVWIANAFVASFSTIFVGCLLAASDFNNAMPFGAPPHVVWYPALSIITGFIMVLYAAACFMATKNATMKLPLAGLFALVNIMMLANFAWVFGKVPGIARPSVGALQHIGLVLSVTILPAYHAIRCHSDP